MLADRKTLKTDPTVPNLSSEQLGKCLRIFSATDTLASSMYSSIIWFASRIWYMPASASQNIHEKSRVVFRATDLELLLCRN
jgi:hypothetical protein